MNRSSPFSGGKPRVLPLQPFTGDKCLRCTFPANHRITSTSSEIFAWRHRGGRQIIFLVAIDIGVNSEQSFSRSQLGDVVEEKLFFFVR